MGNKARVKVEDLIVGGEYWVISGQYSSKVLSLGADGVLVKHLHGNLLIPFSDCEKWEIEEYN